MRPTRSLRATERSDHVGAPLRHRSARSQYARAQGGSSAIRRMRLVATVAVALLLALFVGACSDADGVMRETPSPGITPPPTTTASPTPTTEEQRILAQYRAFWQIQTPASEAPAGQRKAMLEPYATDPALSRVVRGMRASDNVGQVGYGEVIPHPRIKSIEGAVAFLRDCQDGSKAGRKERDTGRIVTRGTARDLAEVTLRHGPDGAWRVATIDYPRGARC